MAHSRALEKVCPTCGRWFAWRAKWADCWDEVVYCSQACKRSKPGPLDDRLERAIVDLLHAGSPGATICPSQAARAVQPDRWQPLMERTRRAARRLAHRGVIEITQGGRVVDPHGFKGPIRLRLRTR
ncbi:MAG: hypothetical protein KatS3mg103_0349 [Phycisphaerales bacterium]|nr:MAG: hypothetical protein KatS3mg103_0349 [Phycisphaerales bacterium]